MFKQMEAAEKVYEGGTPSKTSIGVDVNRDSHDRKRRGGEATSPNNPKKGRVGKRKSKNAGHPSRGSSTKNFGQNFNIYFTHFYFRLSQF